MSLSLMLYIFLGLVSLSYVLGLTMLFGIYFKQVSVEERRMTLWMIILAPLQIYGCAKEHLWRQWRQAIHGGPKLGKRVAPFFCANIEGKKVNVLGEYMNEGKMYYMTSVSILAFNSPFINISKYYLNRWRRAIPKFKELHAKYSKDVDFLTIYIAEAHASDGWSLAQGGYSDAKEPQKLQERIALAKRVIKVFDYQPDTHGEILVDLMDNNSEGVFQAFPDRLMVIRDGIFEYVGGYGPFHYKVEEVGKFLEKNL